MANLETLQIKNHRVVLRYARTTPRKARLIADLIRGLPVNEAEAQLIYNPKRAAKIILKLIASAKAGALAKKFDVDKLFVQNIVVDQGPMFRRFLPRARGMATPLQKKTSHITLILAENESLKPKFNIVQSKKAKPKEKDYSKSSKDKKIKEVSKVENEKSKPKSKEGFFKRIFRRKSI